MSDVFFDPSSDVSFPAVPPGNTRLATIGENRFDYSTSGTDLLVSAFDCDSVLVAYGDLLILCGLGGTPETPFMLAVIEEYVEEKEEVTTTSLTYMLLEPGFDSSGNVDRAVVIASDTSSFETTWLNAIELHLLGAATARGDALALHTRILGGSSTWNEAIIIGLNQFDSTQVVATFEGEGVGVYQDEYGFVISNSHYGYIEEKCCACCSDYWVANYFRPGLAGWTHTKQIVDSHPNKQLDEQPLFRSFQAPRTFGTYKVPRPEL